MAGSCQVQSAEPDSTCTPGAVFVVTDDQVCTPGYATSVRDVAVSEKQQVYAEYGLSYPQLTGAYEVDHLIPLELGGSNDFANLWPEAADPRPGFHEKDGLENWLHDQACTGAMAMTDAQQAIATDWVGAWEAAGSPAANKITVLPTSGSGTVSSTAPAPPIGVGGHTFYASTASNASTIYCDTDPGWQRLSVRNLVSFPSPDAAMAALPGYHWHQPC